MVCAGDDVRQRVFLRPVICCSLYGGLTPMGWVGSWVPKFTWQWVGLGWVSYLVGWVGCRSMKWTHGQLCSVLVPLLLFLVNKRLLTVREVRKTFMISICGHLLVVVLVTM